MLPLITCFPAIRGGNRGVRGIDTYRRGDKNGEDERMVPDGGSWQMLCVCVCVIWILDFVGADANVGRHLGR